MDITGVDCEAGEFAARVVAACDIEACDVEACGIAVSTSSLYAFVGPGATRVAGLRDAACSKLGELAGG
jgi:hypothetical protein